MHKAILSSETHSVEFYEAQSKYCAQAEAAWHEDNSSKNRKALKKSRKEFEAMYYRNR